VAVLAAERLTFGYEADRPVVRDVDFRLEPGEVLFLLGHNGCGKTSLLSCLNGGSRPTSGRATLDGRDVRSMAPAARARRIGAIPQQHVASFAYRVRDVVAMGRTPHLPAFAGPGPEDEAIVRRALERLGLGDLAERPYTELSGGERQLVMVARGLAQSCEVLLMDEPDAHLDPRNRFRVLEAVRELSREAGLSFVVTSHAPNAALTFADRVVLMREGRTLACGPVEETLTEELLTRAYDLPTEVVTKVVGGRRVPRAVLPRRIDRVPDDVETRLLDADSLADPDSELSRLCGGDGSVPARIVVTGARGAGKSRWCERLVRAAERRGWRVAGVRSPAVHEAGRKVAIDLVDVASGGRRRLAERRRDDDGGVTTERWRFDGAAIVWGDEVLRAAADERPDLLVVDELGPLEFRRGAGLHRGLRALDAGTFRVACVVVRPSLLDEALRRWPDAVLVDVED
jgi:iron complex transport system ATP-binding protein